MPLPTPDVSLDDFTQIKGMSFRSRAASNSDSATPVTISSGGKHEEGLGLLSPVKVLHDDGGTDFSVAKSKSPGIFL